MSEQNTDREKPFTPTTEQVGEVHHQLRHRGTRRSRRAGDTMSYSGPSCPVCSAEMSWHENTMRWVCKPCLSCVTIQYTSNAGGTR